MKIGVYSEFLIEAYTERYIKNNEILSKVVSHFDCQDTELDGEVECYFYFPVKYKNDLGTYNTIICEMYGIPYHSPLIEDENDLGHPGEIRFEYIISLKDEEGV